MKNVNPLFPTMGSQPSILMLSRWLSPFILFIPIAISLRHGFLHNFVYSIALFLAVFFITVVFRNRFGKMEPTLGEKLFQHFTTDGYDLTVALLRLLSFFQLYLLALGGAYILHALFLISMQVSMFIFLLLAIFMVQFKPGAPHRHHVKVGLFLLTITGLLVYIFMTKSLEQVYNGVRLYHPYLLYVDGKSVGMFFIVSFLILCGKLIIDPITWQALVKLRSRQSYRSPYMVAFVWSSIGIAFAAITYAMVYIGFFHGIVTVFENLFSFLNQEFIYMTLAILFIYILLDTFEMETRIFNRYRENDQNRFPYGLFLLVPFMYGTSWLHDFLTLFFLFGIVYAAFLPAFIKLLWTKSTLSIHFPLTIIFSSGIGYLSLLRLQFEIGVLIAFGLSVYLSLVKFEPTEKESISNT
ncbi:hypothetical protein [Salirhabdus salicampi]|uniref:hypothetical protein n=1 Tax=Salirhabdus salicampi TaxID=476102 RepID=UPI0020C57946|nr:hypothetical protein [Salirhabdus salicampi]MCP8615897.1 hypothetical protein [Salirhabdus salicampi]